MGHRLHWYAIESLLGQGGFGITYLARDTNLNQPVAIKEFLPTELASRDSDSQVHPLTDGHSDTFSWGLSRFITEAQTLARFRHPNIVRVISVFEANNTAYMVMEYELGESLETAFRLGRIRDEAAMRAVLDPLLDGLEQVHAVGFIHRDIKPDNIYLRADGTPVLLDFGSARQAVGVPARTLTALVSPGYAPFEQYDNSRDADARQGPWTDVYALGATVYRGITGRGPPDAMARVNAAMAGGDVYKPLAGRTGVGFGAVFLAAVDRALGLRPEDRPASIEAWRCCLDGKPEPPVQRTPATTRTGEDIDSEAPTEIAASGASRAVTPAATAPARSRPGAAVAVLLLVGLAVGAGWWLRGDDPQPASVVATLMTTSRDAQVGEAAAGTAQAIGDTTGDTPVARSQAASPTPAPTAPEEPGMVEAPAPASGVPQAQPPSPAPTIPVLSAPVEVNVVAEAVADSPAPPEQTPLPVSTSPAVAAPLVGTVPVEVEAAPAAAVDARALLEQMPLPAGMTLALSAPTVGVAPVEVKAITTDAQTLLEQMPRPAPPAPVSPEPVTDTAPAVARAVAAATVDAAVEHQAQPPSPPVAPAPRSVAILPVYPQSLTWDSGGAAPDDVVDAMRAAVAARTDIELRTDQAWGATSDDVPDASTLWGNNDPDEPPDDAVVFRIGEQLGVDLVVLWSLDPLDTTADWPVYVDVYATESRRRYRLEGGSADAPATLNRLLDRALGR